MSYEGASPTKFGRYQVAMPVRPDRMHFHLGAPLKTVDHEPPVPVLDQEDLEAQGIDTSALVPGARRVDALGSCTCNAGTAHLAERWKAAGRDLSEIRLPVTAETAAQPATSLGLSGADSKEDEEFAIVLYHLVTDQTGSPATEWPPTDCGSSGLYVCDELVKQKLATGHSTAPASIHLVSLLQGGSVMVGLPWFNAWMEPDTLGFVDGNGSIGDLLAAVRSGVAGGHETCISAIEQLHLSILDVPDPDRTVFRVRNSWSPSFGDHGSYRIHLSTLQMLGTYADFKQIIVPAA